MQTERQRNVARDISCFEALWQPTPSWLNSKEFSDSQNTWHRGNVLKKTLSVITVQVRIFSGLDRNYLKYSLRICEICLFMNAKVSFLVICLASAILYVTRHLVICEGLCIIFGQSRHKKIKIKKNATKNLTRCLTARVRRKETVSHFSSLAASSWIEGASGCRLSPYMISPHPPRPMTALIR